ncbi:MAG: hypothetical protein E7498_07235 [Ruminococcus sp.]|nr:hypothetical protein [Ruminococcus sp.]
MIKGLFGILCRLFAAAVIFIAGTFIVLAAVGMLVVWCVKNVIGKMRRNESGENRRVYEVIDVTEG